MRIEHSPLAACSLIVCCFIVAASFFFYFCIVVALCSALAVLYSSSFKCFLSSVSFLFLETNAVCTYFRTQLGFHVSHCTTNWMLSCSKRHKGKKGTNKNNKTTQCKQIEPRMEHKTIERTKSAHRLALVDCTAEPRSRCACQKWRKLAFRQAWTSSYRYILVLIDYRILTRWHISVCFIAWIFMHWRWINAAPIDLHATHIEWLPLVTKRSKECGVRVERRWETRSHKCISKLWSLAFRIAY